MSNTDQQPPPIDPLDIPTSTHVDFDVDAFAFALSACDCGRCDDAVPLLLGFDRGTCMLAASGTLSSADLIETARLVIPLNIGTLLSLKQGLEAFTAALGIDDAFLATFEADPGTHTSDLTDHLTDRSPNNDQ